MLTNPNPLSIGTASGLWLTVVDLTPSRVAIIAMPFNGERLAGSPSDATQIIEMTGDNPAAKALVDTLFAEVARITGKPAADVHFLRVVAPDPVEPVKAEAGVVGLKPAWACEDLFALAAKDEKIAVAIGAIYAFVQGDVAEKAKV